MVKLIKTFTAAIYTNWPKDYGYCVAILFTRDIKCVLRFAKAKDYLLWIALQYSAVRLESIFWRNVSYWLTMTCDHLWYGHIFKRYLRLLFVCKFSLFKDTLVSGTLIDVFHLWCIVFVCNLREISQFVFQNDIFYVSKNNAIKLVFLHSESWSWFCINSVGLGLDLGLAQLVLVLALQLNLGLASFAFLFYPTGLSGERW